MLKQYAYKDYTFQIEPPAESDDSTHIRLVHPGRDLTGFVQMNSEGRYGYGVHEAGKLLNPVFVPSTEQGPKYAVDAVCDLLIGDSEKANREEEAERLKRDNAAIHRQLLSDFLNSLPDAPIA